MKTKDGRRIISGFYSTEEERKACLTPEQWKVWKKLEKEISKRDTGTKEIVKSGGQQRIVGKSGETNPWEHSEGTIGNTIDYCVQSGIFTKEQIKILAGTTMTKVNSHIYSMEKQDKYVFHTAFSNNQINWK